MDLIDRIEKTLDTLRPYIASHRGRVEVVDFDEGEGLLLLRLGGTCHGCAASTVTLRQGIETRLREAERWLAMEPAERDAAGMVVVDDEQFRSLPAAVNMYRAALALTAGDLTGTVTHASRVRELARHTDAHVEMAVIHRAQLDQHEPARERRFARAIACHAEQALSHARALR